MLPTTAFSALLGSAAAAALLAAPTQAQTWFTDQSDAYGVGYKHVDGNFSYAMGGGAAWFDYDNDGDEDLLATNSFGRHDMFRNDGGVFTEVTVESGVELGYITDTIGVMAGDYDGDGWIDVYLTNSGANILFHNNADGSFTDVAAAEGVAGDDWSSCSAWGDWDKDGDLDLYVGNYVDSLNFPYHFGGVNRYYENQGDVVGPRFVERAAELGIDDFALFGPSISGFPYISPEGQATAGCALSICSIDWDEDGDQDILVGNDFGQWVTPNKLYRNDLDLGGGLAFTDITEETNFDERPHYNMGINGADYDHDGDWDFYKSNLGDNLLLRNDKGLFADATYTAGVASGETADGTLLVSSWSIQWADFDLDTFEDLYVSNGVIPAAPFIKNDPRAANDLYLNDGDGTFTEVADELSGAADDGAGRGVAMCDVNRDGLLDFYLMNNGAPGVGIQSDFCRLFVANPAMVDPANGFLQLRLRGTTSNWEAFGSRIDALVDGVVLKRQLLGDPVFLCSSSREVHFGLGTASEVESVQIHWPQGTFQEIVGVPRNLQLEIFEPQVLMSGLQPTEFDGANKVVRFKVDLASVAAGDEAYGVLLQVRFGEGGPIVHQASAGGVLGGGGSTTQTFEVPVTPSIIAAITGQGFEFDVRAYVVAGTAVDSRRNVDPIP
ncbi:CRTAC1 family protein [Engelhardtia mirabilis]|uniref:ASPIC and UnbV n=1 Tax=Engelhardtia mirabilis TaxID=2528011 RepID=A0A518BFQ4_9BACT|nr:ASPIC and UnbV [Planctomycetes bacterium Pla133]QDV00131.1 ASPIC and UnbV [Planctomycetes bacterium Pla86]